MMTSKFLKDLLLETKDGEWGKGEPSSNEVRMQVIRGTDFSDIQFADLKKLPIRYIPQHIAERKQLKTGDVLIETAGGSKGTPTGRTVLVRESIIRAASDPLICASFSRFLRPNTQLIEPAFLYWYLQWLYQVGVMETYQIQHTGIARFQYTKFASEVSLSLPSLADQKAIVGILNCLNDKIELNRHMNATLESIAQALFRAWFVDFEPVKASGLQPAELDAKIAVLFPSEFEGNLPKGWQLVSLDSIIDFALGGDWGKSEASSTETEAAFCIRGADIPNMQEGGIGKMPTRFLKGSSLEKRALQDGDLVIEISGGSPTQSTGRPVLITRHLLKQLEYPLVTSNFCRMVRFHEPSHARYVYLWMRDLYTKNLLYQFETGTTGIKNFAFSLFSQQMQIALPPIEVSQAFDALLKPIFEQLQANGAQSRALTELRDSLLPRLISGNARVPHFEVD